MGVAGQGRVAARPLAIQRARDPEIQRLHVAVSGHEDVAGLEVSMHQEMMVRVLDRLTHFAEEVDPGVYREAAAVAVLVDRCAFRDRSTPPPPGRPT
jgi:hypothetical protein